MAVGKAGTVLERPSPSAAEDGTSDDGDTYDGRGENYDGDEESASSGDSTSGDTDGSTPGSADGSTSGSAVG